MPDEEQAAGSARDHQLRLSRSDPVARADRAPGQRPGRGQACDQQRPAAAGQRDQQPPQPADPRSLPAGPRGFWRAARLPPGPSGLACRPG